MSYVVTGNTYGDVRIGQGVGFHHCIRLIVYNYANYMLYVFYAKCKSWFPRYNCHNSSDRAKKHMYTTNIMYINFIVRKYIKEVKVPDFKQSTQEFEK